MLADIAALTSRRAPTLRVPHNAVYPPPLAAEAVARFTGREPFVSLDSLRMRASASARGRDGPAQRSRRALRGAGVVGGIRAMTVAAPAATSAKPAAAVRTGCSAAVV